MNSNIISRTIVCLFLIFNFFCVYAQKTHDYTPSASGTKTQFGMTFDTRHFDLGKVKKGEKRTMEYTFTNTGKEDIDIEIISACECTTLDWPRRKIKPGEKGKITAIFDSTEKEASETIEIDINLNNREQDTGYKRLEIISYSFELVP